MCMNIQDTVKQCYEWQKSKIHVTNWAKALNDVHSWINLLVEEATGV
jgi:hypothetical protein